MKIKEAKKNIMKNWRANYTADHMGNHDKEIFLLNAMEQLESICKREFQISDKEQEAIKNLERDYIKNVIRERIQKIDNRLQGIEPTEGELGVIQGYKNVINLIDGKF